MKTFLKSLIFINAIVLVALFTISIYSVPTAYAALVDRWEVTEYLCDQYHSSNPQQEYTRGECWRDPNGPWISCSNWDCTLRYISDRPC